MSIVVQLPKFEGPLALLLYLIRKEEMNIMDIKIHEITKQYLEFIKLMKEFDLEVAGEFIAMASTLIHIKSRMLLPQYDENGEVVEQEDPRKELVQKLLEYQKYQEAAKLLYERPLLGRDIWVRGQRQILDVPDDEIILEDNALFSLISAYRKAMQSAKKKIHQVAVKLQSIASRILEMKERLIIGAQVRMSDLLYEAEHQLRHRLITFLSLLELGKMGFVQLYQTDVYGEIYINTLKPIETDVISRVEEYDALHSEQAAELMFAKAEEENQLLLDENIEFELKDVDEQVQPSLETPSDAVEDMASDDDILKAEMEMAVETGEIPDNDQVEMVKAGSLQGEIDLTSETSFVEDHHIEAALNIEMAQFRAELELGLEGFAEPEVQSRNIEIAEVLDPVELDEEKNV